MRSIDERQLPTDMGDGRWLLRVEEAAQLLGISRASLYGLIAKGDLPSVRIAGCRRIHVGELREWLKNQSQ